MSRTQSPDPKPTGSRDSLALTLAVVTGVSIVVLSGLCLVGAASSSRLFELQSVLSLGLVVLTTIAMIRSRQAIQTAHEAGRQKLPVSKQYGYLMALLRITRLLGSSATLQETLDGITQTALDLFEAEQTSVLLFNESNRDLEVRSAAGLLEAGVVGHRQTLGEGIAGQVAMTGEPLLMGTDVDKLRFPGARTNPYSISASMVVPIRLREELVGVLCVSRRTPGRSYDADDLSLVQVFGEVVAVYIRRTQQAAWMRETIQRLESLVPSNRKAA